MNSRERIIEELRAVFQSVFKGGVPFSEEAARPDFSDWDSLNHMRLMLQLEERFSLKLDMRTVVELQNGKSILAFILKENGIA